MINKLNCSNYQVSTDDFTIYVTDGIRGLFELSKKFNLNFKTLCYTLNYKHEFVVKDVSINLI